MNELLADHWGPTGPSITWTTRVGSGYAGPAIVSDRVILFHRIGEFERVEALDVTSGQRLWRTDFQARYSGGFNPDSGPRCVPLVHEGRIYVFGASGDLHCVQLETGRALWSRTLCADHEAPESYFGVGSTPIVVDAKLLVNVGGRDGSGLVALALDTGKTLWKSSSDQASYSSPTTAHLDGRPHALFVTRLNALLVDPNDGRICFRLPFGKRGSTVNAATPLVIDDRLFLTASYGIGAVMARFTSQAADVVWQSDDVLSSQYNTAVYHDGYLYGIHGREDIGRAQLRCVDANRGTVAWSEKEFGMAHLIAADEKLLLVKGDGQIILARPTPTKFVRLSSARPFTTTTRALPALSGGRLLVRDNKGDDSTLRCIQVGR